MAFGSGTLQQGSEGQDVRQLQQLLAEAGVYDGAIDGIYGSKTAAAVREYQKSHAIGVDGIVGPETWGKINEFGGELGQYGEDIGQEGEGGEGGETSSLEQQIRDDFPGLAPFLDVPELRDLLTEAAEDGWTQDKFLAELRGTAWWDDHSRKQQEWVTLPEEEQQRRIEEEAIRVVETYEKFYGHDWIQNRLDAGARGFSDPSHDHAQMWARRIASGEVTFEEFAWKVKQGALQYDDTSAGFEQGERERRKRRRLQQPEEIAEDFRQTAFQDYLLDLSDKTLNEWGNRVWEGNASEADFKNFLRNRAQTDFQGFQDEIERGATPRSLFDPGIRILSRELEQSDDAVLNDPKFLNEIRSQASGAKSTFTAADWIDYARSDPRFKRTQRANEMTADLSDRITQVFGQKRV